MRARRICSVPGCPNIAIMRGRCAPHAEQERLRHVAARPAPRERERGEYGYQWQQIREEFLKAFPNCFVCGKPATDVDHIMPRRQGGSDTWGNLQSLCHVHHSQKTARYDGGYGNARRAP